MKAIIAIDSFKGCLTSAEAGKAALKAFADGEAEVIPVSDGGEGFSTILTESLQDGFLPRSARAFHQSEIRNHRKDRYHRNRRGQRTWPPSQG